jgi:protein transport protein YIF1
LGVASSKALLALSVEIFLVKLGCYFFSVQKRVPFLDLTAYSGYKFVPVVVSLLFSFLAPYYFHITFLAYLMISLGFFSLRSMRYVVIPEGGMSSSSSNPQWRNRIRFLIAVVLIQIFFSWILIL